MKLVAVALRNYKCYGSTEIVPLLFGVERFTGFLGENGVGKSAVLEALNSFFTGQNWVRNKTSKTGSTQCGVAPISLCDENELSKNGFSVDEVKKLKKHSKEISKALKKQIPVENNHIYVSCIAFQSNDTSLFDGTQKVSDEDGLGAKVKDYFLKNFKYIYIEAEVDIDSGTSINSKTTEFIKGSGVVGEITKILQASKITIDDSEKTIARHINEMVIAYLENDVIKKLQEVDTAYNYKNLRTGAQSNLSERHISELAAQALFGNRELTKRIKTKDIGISDMSSGQRRRAFLDFIIVMIGNLGQKERESVILAIDEPEISVDAGSRIQQFDKLHDLTKGGASVIFTTHWYGWITQMLGGNAVLIKELDDGRQITASKASDFLELDEQKKAPYEMRMMFDFLSSLGAWSEADKSKKFILCEGPTDKIYVTRHFNDYKVIPLRGRDEVIRLFKIFSDYYIRVSDKPTNIVFLIDTDPEKAAELKDSGEINLKRISRNTAGEIKIVSRDENYSEKCSIEDLLSPRPFLEAIKSVANQMLQGDDKVFIDNLAIKYSDQTGIRAFGLDEVQRLRLKTIFKLEGFKLMTSEAYNPNEDEEVNFKNLLQI